MKADSGFTSFTPVAALLGKIGASSVVGRDMKIKLGFANYMANAKSGFLAAIYQKLKQDQGYGFDS